MEIKDCKGCRSEQYMKENDINFTTCGLLHSHIKRKSKAIKNLSMCPCVECLIKGICNTECKQYKEYRDNVIELPGF